MRPSGTSVLVPFLLLGLLSGCTAGSAGAAPGAPDADGAPLASWSPPAGAPAYCSLLAGARSIGDLPAALGGLAADPWEPAAMHEVSATRSDLQTALEAIQAERGPDELIWSLHDLVVALDAVPDAGASEASVERIRTDLDAVGRRAQPVCGYPT